MSAKSQTARGAELESACVLPGFVDCGLKGVAGYFSAGKPGIFQEYWIPAGELPEFNSNIVGPKLLLSSTANSKTPARTRRFTSFDFRISVLSIGNRAMGLPGRRATCASATGGVACAAPWPRSGGCVRALQRTTARLLRACVRCRRPGRSAS